MAKINDQAQVRAASDVEMATSGSMIRNDSAWILSLAASESA